MTEEVATSPLFALADTLLIDADLNPSKNSSLAAAAAACFEKMLLKKFDSKAAADKRGALSFAAALASFLSAALENALSLLGDRGLHMRFQCGTLLLGAAPKTGGGNLEDGVVSCGGAASPAGENDPPLNACMLRFSRRTDVFAIRFECHRGLQLRTLTPGVFASSASARRSAAPCGAATGTHQERPSPTPHPVIAGIGTE